VIYSLRHLTTYRYARTVNYARCNLRLRPRDGGGQQILASTITVTPIPKGRGTRDEYFGPQALTLIIDQPHKVFSVEATSRVVVERPALPDPESGPSWEAVREAALALPTLDASSPAHFLFPSRRVPLAAEVTDYARRSFPPGRSAYGGCFDLMNRIRSDFRFDAKATTVSTPLAKSFELKAGVCQDFAHVMIAGLRGLGLPAAYVSGYLRTRPPPGQARLRGADASHAWVSVWCGNGAHEGAGQDGWFGLDPTNACGVRDDHIELTVGRDYSDVTPIDGIVSSPGGQKLKVEVDVVPDDEDVA
jgi:transglutaminase-like putative cysteine protease